MGLLVIFKDTVLGIPKFFSSKKRISHKYAYHDYNGFCCKTVPVEGNKGCNNDDYAVCPHTNVHDGSKKTCISNDKDIDSLSNNYFRSNNW